MKGLRGDSGPRRACADLRCSQVSGRSKGGRGSRRSSQACRRYHTGDGLGHSERSLGHYQGMGALRSLRTSNSHGHALLGRSSFAFRGWARYVHGSPATDAGVVNYVMVKMARTTG